MTSEEPTTPDLVERVRDSLQAGGDRDIWTDGLMTQLTNHRDIDAARDGLVLEVREYHTLDEALQAVGPAE